MDRTPVRSRGAEWLRVVVTAFVSSILTAVAFSVLAPEPALTGERPVVVVQEPSLYPCVAGEQPQVTYESHAAFVEDYLALKQDVRDLRQAVDYDASKGNAGPSLHEWADRKAPGTFGGGRKP